MVKPIPVVDVCLERRRPLGPAVGVIVFSGRLLSDLRPVVDVDRVIAVNQHENYI